MADLADAYGSSVDSRAAGASLGVAPDTGDDGSSSSGSDYITTQPDLGQVNSAMQAAATYHVQMLDYARNMIGQQPNSMPVKGPGIAISPDKADVGQYTLAPDHDTLIKKVVGHTLDQASQGWQPGATQQAGTDSQEMYGSWLQKPDQTLWTDPLGAINTPGAGDQDSHPFDQNPGTGPADSGTQRIMNLMYR